MIRLDTHVAVWLHAGERARFSDRAVALIDAEELSVSPIVELEVSYLHEIGRLALGGPALLADLRSQFGVTSSEETMAAVAAAADTLGWTRDPFDRLIVGDAAAARSPLLSKDRTIRRHYPLAEW